MPDVTLKAVSFTEQRRRRTAAAAPCPPMRRAPVVHGDDQLAPATVVRETGHPRVGAAVLARGHLGRRAARRALFHPIVVAAALSCVLLAGCGGGSKSSAAGLDRASFEAANFVEPSTSTNPWHPLRPGMQWVRDGTTEVGSRAVPHQVVTTVSDVIRVIDGVPAVAMLDQDTDAGQITQLSIDYMALDRESNVWKLGGYTEEYEGGVFTNTIDASLGVKLGADPGILIPIHPDVSTPRWFVGKHGTDEGSAAEVVEAGGSQCVPFACYDNVLVIREGKISAIDNEFKFYAPGVGQILNSPRKDSKHKDTEELVNLTDLSEQGLAEISAEVMRLEAHARETEPDVFGSAPESTRSR